MDVLVLIFTDPIPLVSQESALMDDLLSCFLGCQGQYVNAEPLTFPMAHRSFRISEKVG